MRPIANHQPVTYVVDAVRVLTEPAAARSLGHNAGYFVGWSLVWCAVIVAVFAPLAVARYRRG
jgi:L-asparagine transporter-like permease